MSLLREESEFVFCDLQGAARFIRKQNPDAARSFLEAAYDTFEFLADNPEAGRRRPDLGFEDVRSFRVIGFRRYVVFYRACQIAFRFGGCCMGRETCPTN